MDEERQSHPVRVRGLKLTVLLFGRSRDYVAPRAGAWVETPNEVIEMVDSRVAPRAGAWVETFSMLEKSS